MTKNKRGENEVELMKFDLINRGVTKLDLILDKKGNRTWNSIVNLKEKKSIIIVSQKFHLERALYIAKKKSVKAVGFAAKGGMSKRLLLREILARVKMQLDLITK